MDQFEYVMVLVSIIVGLGVAHLLLGIGGIIDRISGKKETLELSVAHAAWLVGVFGWLVLFWWWEFRFSTRVTEWTVHLYFFLVLYAVTLFLMCVVLVPRTWDGVSSLKDYFLRRRVWFYSLYLFGTLIDIGDSYLKGGIEYLTEVVGPIAWVNTLVTFPLIIIGMKTRNLTYHNVIAVAFALWQYLVGFGAVPFLAA